jgi:CrcB protein
MPKGQLRHARFHDFVLVQAAGYHRIVPAVTTVGPLARERIVPSAGVTFVVELVAMWQKVLLIAAAGAVGTVSRYGVAWLAQRLYAGALPVGTLAVNAVGCLLFGLVWALSEERALISTDTRNIVLIGFMGAFTTFSTYVFESEQMLRDSEWLMATANFLGQNFLGIACLFFGMALARML